MDNDNNKDDNDDKQVKCFDFISPLLRKIRHGNIQDNKQQDFFTFCKMFLKNASGEEHSLAPAVSD